MHLRGRLKRGVESNKMMSSGLLLPTFFSEKRGGLIIWGVCTYSYEYSY